MIRLRFSTQVWAIDSALIRWRTQCDQSHVEFEREDGSTLGARFPDGVLERPKSANVHQSRVVHATFPEIDKAHDWVLKNLLGAPYNWKGIIGIALARDYELKGAVDCSQTVALGAWYGCNTQLLNPTVIAWWKQTPRDLLLSTQLTVL